MFKLAVKPSYTAQVSGTLPGGYKLSFEVEFARLTQSEIAAMSKGNEEGSIIYADVCRDVVIGWKGVQDDSGEAEFSAGALEQMLTIFPMSKIIFDVWQTTLADARAKN